MNRIILNLILVLLAAGAAQAKDWHGIIPLHSTRSDVERLLGPPTTDRADTVFYDSAAERVSIQFSKGPCNVEFSPWNVPRDIVINIWVTPMLNQLSIADLKLNPEKYAKTQDKHRPQIVYYRNEEDGIEYSVDEGSGKVGLVKYSPSAADKALRCPEPSNRLNETVRFAQYSNISFASEKRILDNFAQQIVRYSSVNYASARAYILVHRARRGRQDEATARAKRAKQYLVNVRHIDPGRIEIVNASDREKLIIELYLVPPGATLRLSVLRMR
jgi:hypothetical protein